MNVCGVILLYQWVDLCLADFRISQCLRILLHLRNDICDQTFEACGLLSLCLVSAHPWAKYSLIPTSYRLKGDKETPLNFTKSLGQLCHCREHPYKVYYVILIFMIPNKKCIWLSDWVDPFKWKKDVINNSQSPITNHERVLIKLRGLLDLFTFGSIINENIGRLSVIADGTKPLRFFPSLFLSHAIHT